MRLPSILCLFFCQCVLLCGCASVSPAAFEGTKPVLEPEIFFTGHTHSSGVFENRKGKPTQRITTATSSHMKDGVLYIEQDLMPERGKSRLRSWQLRRIDAHHVDATANDIIGTAHGAAYGSTFQWSFHLALEPGNPLKNVRMSQAMYLQPDGRSLIIRSVIRKAGFIVAEVTEQFWRD